MIQYQILPVLLQRLYGRQSEELLMRSWEEKGQMSSSETSGKLELMLSVNCDELASYHGKVAILLVGSCYKQRDRFWLPVSRLAPEQT